MPFMKHYRKIDMHCFPRGYDRTGDNHLKKMDANNVQRAVLHGMAEYVIEVCDKVKVADHNAWVLAAVKKHPGRFMGSVMVDLRKPVKSCIALAKKYHEEGFVGVKLYTQLGVDPGLEKYEPFWDALEKMNMIVFPDCGCLLVSRVDPSRRIETRFAEPFSFEVPVRRHPRLRFELVHFGGGITYLQTVRMMNAFENVYSDTSPGDGRWALMNDMPGMRNMKKHKVMFASNSCVYPYEADEEFYVEKLKSVCGYDKKEIEDFFFNNAFRFLGLRS